MGATTAAVPQAKTSTNRPEAASAFHWSMLSLTGYDLALDDIKRDSQARMGKSVEALRHELSHLRTGRASTALVEGIKVNYYGSDVPLNQVATVAVSESKIEDIPVTRIVMGEAYLRTDRSDKPRRFLCLLGEKNKVLLTFFTAR